MYARLLDTIWNAIESFREQCDMLAAGLAAADAEAQLVAVAEAEDAATGADPFETVDADDPATWAKVQPRMLTFGSGELFFSSLREAVGNPAMDGLAAMAREHTVRLDSDLKFNAPNYNITTTSKLEWYLVADPQMVRHPHTPSRSPLGPALHRAI